MNSSPQLTVFTQKAIKKSLIVALIVIAMSMSGFFSIYYSPRFDAMPAGNFIWLFLLVCVCGSKLLGLVKKYSNTPIVPASMISH
jgi:hypothetical protein